MRWLVRNTSVLPVSGSLNLESDAPQMLRIVLACLDACKHDGLITDDAVCTVGGTGVEAPCVDVRLRASNEKSTGLMQQVESREINVSSVHDVDGTRLWQQQIENVHIVQFAV